MNVKLLEEKFSLELVAGKSGMDKKIVGGHCSDLLSEVMGNAPDSGCVWLTVQGHHNIIAVAVLHEMAAVVITGGFKPDEATIKKADEENVPVFLSHESTFDLAGKLYKEGICNTP